MNIKVNELVWFWAQYIIVSMLTSDLPMSSIICSQCLQNESITARKSVLDVEIS